jgi:ketosteroid isomerase-like protein
MSEQNLEIVRRAIQVLSESYEKGEATGALLDLCAPDIRVDASRRVFNPDLYEGEAGIRRLIREIFEASEDFSEATERLIDAGEKVVSLQTIGGRGRVSKAEVQARGALVWTLRDRRIVGVETFLDQREALEAVGLAE